MKKALIALALLLTILSVYILLKPAPSYNITNSTGQALIGGDVTLTDQHNQPFNTKSLRGKHLLVYFGFTNCPHICPTDVNAISNAMNTLSTDQVVPIFITVDPERDTPEQLTLFFQNFHSSFIALTGTKEQIEQAHKTYRVYSQRRIDEELPEYTMDHSAFIYLMDKKGKYVTHFRSGTTGKEIAKKLKPLL